MKFLNIKKNDKNINKINIFGITLFKKYFYADYWRIKLLEGAIYLKYSNDGHFRLRLFGFSTIRTKVTDSKKYRIVYLLFLPVWILNNQKYTCNRFLNGVLKNYSNYDEYYIFLSRSGEFFLLMHHLSQWIKDNGSKNYLLIVCARYHLDICKMFYPNINIAFCPVDVSLISRQVKNVKNSFKGKTIYIPTYEKYFQEVENDIRLHGAHYYTKLKKHLGLNDFDTTNYTISPKVKNKIRKIAEKLLNNNFVIVSPESLSNEMLDRHFWDKLCKRLKLIGYEVFCNCMDFRNLITDTYQCFLTYEETIELARYANAVIGLRSGFLECIANKKVPTFAIYTDFPKRGNFARLESDKIMEGFSLKKLPNINKDLVFEYDINKMGAESVQNDILKIIKLKNAKQEELCI